MLNTSIFNSNPKSSQRRRDGGKDFQITSTPALDGTNSDWMMKWEVPAVDGRLDYDSAEIVVSKGSTEYYRYSTEGNAQLFRLPSGLKERIVNDWNTLTARKEVPEEEEYQTPKTTTVREETVRGITITMTMTTGTLTGTYYGVQTTEGGSRGRLKTQEEAEEVFQYFLDQADNFVASSTTREYRGVEIIFQDTNYKDGEDALNPDGITYDLIMLKGEIQESFTPPHELIYRDQYGTREFGTLTMNIDSDMTILEPYIDARLDPRQDPEYVEPELPTGLLPLYSWGWYEKNNENVNCPFDYIYLENVYTVAETNGRILGLTDDDFIAAGFESGLVKLRVKDGYRVRMKIMTQNRGFLEENISNLDSVGMDFETYDLGDAQVFNQSTNYTDTEKVKIDLFGGDMLEIDIDGISGSPKVKNFYISQRGEQISTGGGSKINDETFLAIIEVERYGEEDLDPGTEPTSTSTGNVLALVVGGALILAVLYMILSSGGEE